MMFGYVSKREHEALKADNARQRDTIAWLEGNLDQARITISSLKNKVRFLTADLDEARAKQPQRGDKGRFVGAGK